jgi:hypothetical protein
MRPRVTSRKCRGSHAGPCWVYLVVRPRMSPGIPCIVARSRGNDLYPVTTTTPVEGSNCLSECSRRNSVGTLCCHDVSVTQCHALEVLVEHRPMR